MSTEMKYIHPHSESRIIDNAVLTVSASGLSNKFIALEAEKGMPNEATYISSPSEYTFTFGEPNYNKFGQSGLNAIQWLRAGGGLWVIRVVPDDETFAGLSIGIGYRANSKYSNDEPEFKRLERTEDQIKVWNAYTPDSGTTVMVKGKSSGNSVLLPKFYACRKNDNDEYEPEVSLGLMTEDEIALLNVGITDTDEQYIPMALRRVLLVPNFIKPENSYDQLKLKFEATVHGTAHDKDDPTTDYYVLKSEDDGRYVESSAAAVEITVEEDGANVKKQAVKMGETSGVATITVVARFAAMGANSVPELLAAYVSAAGDNQTRVASVGTKESHEEKDNNFWTTKYLSRMEEIRNPIGSTDSDNWYTADLINLLKNDVQYVGTSCVKAIISSPSVSVWSNSFEVYHFDPISYGSNEGSVRPISEKEMRTISVNDKTSQPALSVQEYSDWIFVNNLDSSLYAIGTQFTDNDSPALATLQGNILITSEGESLIASGNTDLGGLTATNPEVLVSSPSTGYYSLQKLYYVNDSNGKELYSKTTTLPEAAYYNFNNRSKGRLAKVVTDSSNVPGASQYIYGTSAKTTKTVVEYTMTSKVSTLNDVKVEGFNDGETSESFIATALLGLLKEVGGTGFMSFAANDNGETIVSFSGIYPLVNAYSEGTTPALNPKTGYLSAAEYNSLVDSGNSLANLFIEESELVTGGHSGKFVFNPENLSSLPSDFSGRFKALTANGGLYIHSGDSYSLSKSSIDGWSVRLKVNSFLRDMMLAAGSIEGDGGGDDAGSEPVEIHFAPSYKGAFIDGDSYWGIRMVFDATALDTTLFSAMATAADADHAVTLTGKSTGEYAFYDEKIVYTWYSVGGDQGNFEPNSDYAATGYNAIGFVATPYSVFDYQGSEYQADDLEVIEQRADSTKGRVVGSTLDNIQTQSVADLRVPANCYAEFLRFLPKGSGKWYNRLSVNLAYDDSMDRTYTEWSMFRLTVSEKLDGGEVSRESFNVSLDPDAVSAAKESLFIADVVNRYSKYLTCVMNYDNLSNFIDAKLGVRNTDGTTLEDEDGNEVTIPVDAVVKYIYNQIDLDEFKTRIFGEDYETSGILDNADSSDVERINALMSAIGYDSELCHLDTTLFADDGETPVYLEPFVSLYLFQTLTSTNSLYLNGGSHGRGWGYEHENDDGELVTNSTLEQALVKAYNGTTDSIITNINLCVFDMVMDCNYPVMVKTAMNELSSVIRQDCVTILDQGISTANAQQAIDMRKNSMNYDTFYTSIFTQHLEITDEWSGKPVKVTPTFFLASKIPLNDTAYSPAVNFVGPNRGVISGFNNVSWIPTEPEKDQLYRNQINYIERDNIATLFATELTTQTKNTPLTLIHAVRTLLRLRRSMVAVSRSYRSEFATSDVYGLLQTELNEIASSYVLAGGYEYITPVINTSDYDRQQRICRVDVDVAFTDIIERFAFNFIVNRV
jgi:hypothetical protein